MALWCWLNVNDQRIGLLDIQRHESLDLTDREAVADVVSTYTVRIDGVERATVRHRYGDGAWALLRTALAAAVPDPAEATGE